jgi:hypothetical protein
MERKKKKKKQKAGNCQPKAWNKEGGTEGTEDDDDAVKCHYYC